MPVRVKKTRQHKPAPVLLGSEPQPAPEGLTGDGASDGGASGGDANDDGASDDGASPHDADASAPARALPDQHRPASLPPIRHFRYARPGNPAQQGPVPAEQHSHLQRA